MRMTRGSGGGPPRFSGCRAGAGAAGANDGVMSLIPAKEVRPPLPRGPFLVVGLARSGQAAARLLTAQGETVRAVDSGHPDGAEGLSALGVEVTLDTDGLAQLEGTHTVVVSDGRLTVSNAAGSVNNKIAFVEVTKV